MAIAFPEQLRTSRLLLRAPRLADAQPLYDGYTQDPEVAHYMVWRPHLPLTETERFVASCLEGWQSGERFAYALTLHGYEDAPLGIVEARLRGHMVDLGYVLARAHWGQGLMPEAVTALTETALSSPDCFRVQATCDAENLASARALEKSGFTREARLERHTVHPNLSPEPRACFLYAKWK